MPLYLYRREDGTTFELRQKFLDDPLMVDPATGQKVVRVVQPASVVFKGSGFYVNDSRGKSSTMTAPKTNEGKTESSAGDSGGEAKSANPAAAKPEKVASSAAD